jgi:DNA repair exonuclease SbcCD ATPase subunit
MRITINSLTLDNYKGTQHRTVEVGSQNADITGANGTGKTTIADAWMWLLFDMDTAGRKGVEACKTTEGSGYAHYLTHSVAAEIEVDGRMVTLKKTVEENWTKPRGKSEQVFSGNVSSYWIDEVPTQKKDYDAYIDSLVPVGLFKILSDPMHFSTALHYKERLSVLIELVGGITDAEISEGDDDLQRMLSEKGVKSLDDFKKMLLESRRRANEQAAGIPDRIDENRRVLDGPHEDYSAIESTLANLTASLNAIESDDDNVKARKAEMNRDSAAIWQKRQERDARVSKLVRELNSARDAAQEDILRLEREIKRLKGGISERSLDMELLRSDADDLKSSLEKLRSNWTDANKRLTEAQKRTFSAEVVTVKGRCPTCMQVLPQSMIDEQIAEIRDAFDRETTRLVDTAKQEMDSAQRAGVAAKSKFAELKEKMDAMVEASERDSETKDKLVAEHAAKVSALEGMPVATADSLADHPDILALDRKLPKQRPRWPRNTLTMTR